MPAQPSFRSLSIFLLAGMFLGGFACSGPQPYAEGDWPALHALAETYGLQIIWESQTYPVETRHGTVGGAVPSKQLMNAYVPVLKAEIGHYPVDMIDNAKLHHIVLGRNLTFNGREVNGIADFKPHTLYLDVERLAGEPEQMKKCIHHEFFHVVDYANGTLTSDSAWERLNSSGFASRGGGRFTRDHPEAYTLSGARAGFVNVYATSAAEEDKAELFAFMMVRYNLLKERARGD